jgi:hypothetical protein
MDYGLHISPTTYYVANQVAPSFYYLFGLLVWVLGWFGMFFKASYGARS